MMLTETEAAVTILVYIYLDFPARNVHLKWKVPCCKLRTLQGLSLGLLQLQIWPCVLCVSPHCTHCQVSWGVTDTRGLVFTTHQHSHTTAHIHSLHTMHHLRHSCLLLPPMAQHTSTQHACCRAVGDTFKPRSLKSEVHSNEGQLLRVGAFAALQAHICLVGLVNHLEGTAAAAAATAIQAAAVQAAAQQVSASLDLLLHICDQVGAPCATLSRFSLAPSLAP